MFLGDMYEVYRKSNNKPLTEHGMGTVIPTNVDRKVGKGRENKYSITSVLLGGIFEFILLWKGKFQRRI